jgi:UDP-GlcNAc3NAcA epimerase
MTGRMLEKIEGVLEREKPDWVLIYGDTNSTLAGALAAAKLHIPVAHVEAGLRSFNRAMPEEINRVVADHLSSLLFASTDTAVGNLAHEGIAGGMVRNVGDVMYDAALLFADSARAHSSILDRLGAPAGGYVLATIHRAENTDDPLRLGAIVEALELVAAEMPVILPLHPRTAAALEAQRRSFAQVRTIEPVGYLDMVALESRARIIVTDSGGVQKEAFFYRVPCVTLRDETEWVELVDLGWNRLAPPGSADIRAAIRGAIDRRGTEAAPYGDGRAADRIAAALTARP